MSIHVGLDLGQSTDYTAITIVDMVGPPDAIRKLAMGVEVPPIYRVRYLHRPPLGTSYPSIVEQVRNLLAKLKDPTLVIDATGVGRPVVDMFDTYGVYSLAVTITGGAVENQDGRNVRVPKLDLVATGQRLLQTGRLRIAESLALQPTLVKELNSFRRQQSATGHQSFNARDGEHDDLVLAVCLAVWAAQRECNDSWTVDPMGPGLTHAERALLLGRRADERARRRKLQAQRDPDGIMGELEALD